MRGLFLTVAVLVGGAPALADDYSGWRMVNDWNSTKQLVDDTSVIIQRSKPGSLSLWVGSEVFDLPLDQGRPHLSVFVHDVDGFGQPNCCSACRSTLNQVTGGRARGLLPYVHFHTIAISDWDYRDRWASLKVAPPAVIFQGPTGADGKADLLFADSAPVSGSQLARRMADCWPLRPRPTPQPNQPNTPVVVPDVQPEIEPDPEVVHDEASLSFGPGAAAAVSLGSFVAGGLLALALGLIRRVKGY